MFDTQKIKQWMTARNLSKLITLGVELGALAGFVGVVATGICGFGRGGGGGGGGANPADVEN